MIIIIIILLMMMMMMMIIITLLIIMIIIIIKIKHNTITFIIFFLHIFPIKYLPERVFHPWKKHEAFHVRR